MGAMYQAFGRLDNYNMMIKLIKMTYRYVKSSVIVKDFVIWSGTK
jgi:hypothetical protein